MEILLNSEKLYIPMDGIGYSLNTSQAANIAVYEAVKQYKQIDRSDSKTEIKACENYLTN